MADLETAKNRLVEVLKERTMRYWELMKSWYRRRVRGPLFVYLTLYIIRVYRLPRKNLTQKLRVC